ncbi:hypothetical protein [uncultured Microscilla sp.]|uniref:hypothetical protein n=1 Tax=uncultured Microscilla sp. TaxID=432653 RepID=UPI00262DE45B|nr:hypothetical protein [uncultured Microscilla sp.]
MLKFKKVFVLGLLILVAFACQQKKAVIPQKSSTPHHPSVNITSLVKLVHAPDLSPQEKLTIDKDYRSLTAQELDTFFEENYRYLLKKSGGTKKESDTNVEKKVQTAMVAYRRLKDISLDIYQKPFNQIDEAELGKVFETLSSDLTNANRTTGCLAYDFNRRAYLSSSINNPSACYAVGRAATTSEPDDCNYILYFRLNPQTYNSFKIKAKTYYTQALLLAFKAIIARQPSGMQAAQVMLGATRCNIAYPANTEYYLRTTIELER